MLFFQNALNWLRPVTTAKTETPTGQFDKSSTFWLLTALSIAFVYCLNGTIPAFQGQYVVQDDVRQHIFWMQRFLDPGLFPHDLMADFFQSMSPPGIDFIYHAAARLGLSPLLLNKLLPLPLVLASGFFLYRVTMRIIPQPPVAFLAVIFMSQSLWWTDDVPSATGRSFSYIFLLATIDALQRDKRVLVLVLVMLQSLFYPSITLLSLGVIAIRLVRFEDFRPRLSTVRDDYIFVCAAGLIGFLFLLPNVMGADPYGPTITAAAARGSVAFGPDGRTPFFTDNPVMYWLFSKRTGIWPTSLFAMSPAVAACFALPFLLKRGPAGQADPNPTGELRLLGDLIIVSIVLWAIAHATLFLIYLPGRYTAFGLRPVLVIAAAMALSAIWRRVPLGPVARTRIAPAAMALIVVYPFLVTHWLAFPRALDVRGAAPDIYTFLKTTPKDTMVAGLDSEASAIPSFAARSVLVSRETFLAYKLGYFDRMIKRLEVLIGAVYSPGTEPLRALVEQYGVDYLLIDKSTFVPKNITGSWWWPYDVKTSVPACVLASTCKSALQQYADACTTVSSGSYRLINATCILNNKRRWSVTGRHGGSEALDAGHSV